MHKKHNNSVKFCKVYTLKKMTYIDFSHPRESTKILEKIQQHASSPTLNWPGKKIFIKTRWCNIFLQQHIMTIPSSVDKGRAEPLSLVVLGDVQVFWLLCQGMVYLRRCEDYGCYLHWMCLLLPL